MLKKLKPELSIVLPVFNEEQNIPLVVAEYLKLTKVKNIEVIFVEDTGSTDKTREVIKKFSRKYTFVKALLINERGYGLSLYSGLKFARGKFICWTHADLQTDPKDTIRALNIIQKNSDEKVFVKGKRYGIPLSDSFFTFGMSVFETLILGKPLYDINAQPNLFHNSFIGLIKDPPSDFSFDLYIYYTAKKEGYKILRFPVLFKKRIYGHSAWNNNLASKIKFIKRTIKFTFDLKKRLNL